MLVYIDDIIVTGSNYVEIEQLLYNLGDTFALKDLGQLTSFLALKLQEMKKHWYLLAYMAINIDFDDNKPHAFIKQRFINYAFMMLWNLSIFD